MLKVSRLIVEEKDISFQCLIENLALLKLQQDLKIYKRTRVIYYVTLPIVRAGINFVFVYGNT